MNTVKAQEYINRYKDEFEVFDTDEFCSDEVESFMDSFTAPYTWWREGASKLVICIDEEDDFVLKIPFASLSDEYGEYIDIPDYCEKEVSVYKEACACNVDEFLCKEEYLTSVGGTVKIYIQEKVNNDYYSEYTFQENSEYVRSNDIKGDIFNWSFVADCIRAYGAASTAAFVDFISSANVNDLHATNLGFTEVDGKMMPKIFDYSGWYDNDRITTFEHYDEEEEDENCF